MQKKLTITIDETVYEALHRVVGRGRISKFIENMLRQKVLDQRLDSAYREMALDEAREGEATEWTEALIGDVDEAR